MLLRRVLSFLPVFFLLGCSSNQLLTPAGMLSLHGNVHGGQQPVSGSSLQLYAVGLSGGGSTATPLLTTAVNSDANGNFTITGDYACPTAGSEVYIMARGGNPGLAAGTNNAAISLAAPVGACGSLSASTFINVNEVTTVALANTVAPFTYTLSAIGSTPADAVVLNSAFAMANRFASTSTGTSPGGNVPFGYTVPAAEINTLADILSVCVNSAGGVAGDSSACGNLFSLTTASGLSAPTDTFSAAVRIAGSPSMNTAALFNTTSASAPFQPTLSAVPRDFSVGLNVTAGLQASMTTAEFGSMRVGSSSAAQTLTLQNTSGSPVAISSIRLSGVFPTDFTATHNCPSSLAPSATCFVQLGFTPGQSGRRIAVLSIVNDTATTPLMISLSGIGVQPPVTLPTLISSLPASLPTGSPSTTITLNGTGFTPTSSIYVGGLPQATTYISSQAVSFVLNSNYTTSSRTLSILVANSAGSSNTLSFAVANPAPVLAAISPGSVIAGSPNFTLILTGTGFSSNSAVLVNGVSQTPNSSSATSLTIMLTSAQVASPATLNISVSTPGPGGGTSAVQQLQVISTGTRIRRLSYATADVVADPSRNVIYASVSSSSATSPNSIIAIDPAQGTVLATSTLTSSPDRIAVSDDGSYLYVSLPSTATIGRFALPSLTPDIQWTLGTGAANDLQVAPGLPHTVAVTSATSQTVIIYDDGVARPVSPVASYANTSFDTIAWGANASNLFATRSPFSGGPEYVLSIDTNGATLANTFPGAFGDFLRRLTYDKTTNRLYDGYGNAVDPATGKRVGLFNIQNTLPYEQNTIAVDGPGARAFILNENYFNQQNSSQTEDIQAFDLNSFTYINALTLPDLSGSRIIRWGAAGLAVGGGSQVILIDGGFVSSTSTASPTGGYAGVSPTITALSPQAVTAGDGPVDVVVTGKDFTPAALATWNKLTLPVTYQSATQVTVTFPASYLALPVAANLSLTNGPGTEASNAVPFSVLPSLGPNTQVAALGVSGQDMVWDPLRGLLYVSVTDPSALNGNSIVAVDPAVPAIKNVVPTGFQPSTLGISDDQKYVYAGFQTLAAVKRYALADLSLNLTIPLTQGLSNQNFAGDIKVAPGQNQTIAVSLGTRTIEPRDTGGLVIFDDATPRTRTLPYSSPDTFKLAWGKDATRLYAHTDPQFQPQGFSILAIDSTGITGRAAAFLGYTDIALRPHYDAGTDLVYSDGGRISNPLTGAASGSLSSSGLMVPDSGLNRAFVLRSNGTSTAYSLDIFDLRRQTLLKSIAVPALSGYPTQLVRWGAQGIAILTDGPGMLYLLQGSDISGVTAAPPNAITLSPASIIAGASSGRTVALGGSNFLPTSAVFVNGVQQPTTFLSSTQLTFQITAAEQSFARYLSVSVANAGTAGGASPDSVLEVDNPVPSVASLNSPTLSAGSAGVSLVLTGSGFLPSSIVNFSGSPRSSTFSGPTSLSVALSSSDLSAAGVFNLSVTNPGPGGGSSAAFPLEIDNPAPVITSLSPSTVSTGSGSQVIYVFGTGFTSSTVIKVNGSGAATTYSSSTQVHVTLPASYFSTRGSLNFIASNPAPGGGSSAAASLAVNDTVPGPITLSPSTVIQGSSSPASINVLGTNFVPGSVVQVGGASRTTTYLSPTQLTFVLTVADQTAAGPLYISVVNPVAGGGSSPVAVLTVAAASPTAVISSVNPSQFIVNSGAASIQVFASGLTSSSFVQWNGTALSGSAYPGSGYIFATVPAALLTAIGTANIAVNTPTSTPPASNAFPVSVVAPPAPTLTSISPSSGPFNQAFSGTLTGTNFTAASVVSINGDPLTTTFQSSSQLLVSVPANEVMPGNNLFTVATPAPGGGTSATVSYTAYIPQSNNSMIFNPGNGLFYLSVPGSAGLPYGNSIVSVDPVTGALGNPIFVGSEPNRMALTDDHRFLWVGLDGANAVRKVDLAAGTAGMQFGLPLIAYASTPPTAAALVAVPGQTDSVAVSIPTPNSSYKVAVFDAGVPRANSVVTSALSLQIDGTRNELYAAAGNAYQVLTYNSSGLTQKTSTTTPASIVNSSNDRIQVAGGRAYADLGQVLDAETGVQAGVFTSAPFASFSVAVDLSLGRAFVLDSTNSYASYPNRIQIFNTSDFSAAGTASIPVTVVSNLYAPYPAVSGLTRWGGNGLAFRNNTSVFVLRSNLVQDLSTANADLAVTLSSSGPNATGTSTTYTAQVTNAGPASASEVRFTALAPTTGTLASLSASAGSCVGSGLLACDLGVLYSGTSATITLTVNQSTPGTATLAARVSASQADPNPADNQASSTALITGTSLSPVPALLSISPSTILAGSDGTSILATGQGFSSASTLQLDGAPLVSTVVDSTHIAGIVPSSALTSLGWHAITVTAPAPGGASSGTLPLSVYSAIKAGANRIAYDPFSRRLIATLGSSTPAGNSLEFLQPDTGAISSVVNVGSEPTSLALSDDGQMLYVLLTGSNGVERFNMLTQQPESSFALTPQLGTNSSGQDEFAVQPGSENTLGLTQSGYQPIQIIDFDPAARTASARSANSGSTYGSSPRFFDASHLLLLGTSTVDDYVVNAAGLGPFNAATSSSVKAASPFKLANKLAFTGNGGVSDFSVLPARHVGAFPVNFNNTEASVAPDPAIGRAFFLAGFDGTSVYSSSSLNGVAAFDTNSFLPLPFIPLNIPAANGTSAVRAVDVLRWGQDGLAALTSNGDIYLVRGPAVLSQLLQPSTAPTLDPTQSTSLQHGAGNTVLALTGSNFLPGIAAAWNGSYRSTTYVDATHVTLAIPSSDLSVAGSASITAANPNSPSSSAIVIPIN